MRLATVAILGLAFQSCGASTKAGNEPTTVATSNQYHTCGAPDCRTYDVLPFVARHARYGFACSGNVPPLSTPNPLPPPIEYDANDAGKPGFPRLLPRERRLLAAIEAKGASPALKLAWVDGARPGPGPDLIVFIDPGKACSVEFLKVINGACNEYYEPSENPYHTVAVPSDAEPACRSSRR